MLLAPGTYAVTLSGADEIVAFGDWLDANPASVTLFDKPGGDAMILEPGGLPSEFVVFHVHFPVEWTLGSEPVPAELLKPGQEARDDATPAPRPGSPGKGEPDGGLFGGGLLSGTQLVWVLLLGLYFYSKQENRS